MRNIQLSITAVLFSLLLVACGGGGTLDGGGTGASPEYTLELALLDSAGAESSSLSEQQPLTVRATLTATQNETVAGRVIRFSIDQDGLAKLSTDTGSVLTDSNGVATLTLTVGDVSGAGQLMAEYIEGETLFAEAVAGFQSAGDGGEEVDINISSVKLLVDKLQLGSGQADKVEISALIRDSNNVLLTDIPVTFSATSGELVVTAPLTEQDGLAKAQLTSKVDSSLRPITVRARVNDIIDEVDIAVVGTTLELVAPSSVVLGDEVTINVFLSDSSGRGLGNEPLEVSSELGNALSTTNPVTGSGGQASFTYTAASSGTDQLTVSGLGINQSVSFDIRPDTFVFLKESDDLVEIPLNEEHEVQLQWLQDNVAVVGETVQFTTTRGQIADMAGLPAPGDGSVIANSTTDSDGIANAFVASDFAGVATIGAAAGEDEARISTQTRVEFIATVPDTVVVQAFPKQLGPGEKSAVRAVVRDAKNNPVKNQTVVFSLSSAAGGELELASAKTNSQGVANTVFVASSTTAFDGLEIVADVVDSSVSNSTTVNVGERALFFRFGTGNTVATLEQTMFVKEFSVIVTDASGNPIPNKELNVAAVSNRYSKGYWIKTPPPPESFKVWAPVVTVTCPSEDLNNNGILDAGEDVNGSGELTPGNVATVEQSIITNAEGIGLFNVTYPKDMSPWVEVRLSVSGTAEGTEHVASRLFSLAYATSYVDQENSPPAANPFGTGEFCTDTD
ncbi:MAG: Ig-like domain-containing protein [Alkalimonas sp.]|nr:Ig-like domain-containing protein [Alkalimonas sp.]